MTGQTQVKITGVEQLEKNLKLLSRDIGLKGARFAGRKAANIIRDAAIVNAKKIDDPNSSEQIAKNIAVRFSSKAFKRTGDVQFRIGVLGGAKGFAKASGEIKGKGKENAGGDTYYWRFIEFGTSSIPAKPFLLPALRDNTQTATDEFSSQFQKWISRRIAKMKKSGEM